MNKQHNFTLQVKWTGNKGTGTSDYREYERHHAVIAENKVDILCSSDPAFRGDGTKHNPEDFFIASLSSCHMLWYLHLCADAGVIVTDYIDNVTGVLSELPEGGRFTEVTLQPIITVKDESMKHKAIELHETANKKCFIANSVNFKVKHEISVTIAS